MALNVVVTTAGRAALVNAANTGTAPVTITQIGLSQTAVVPTAAMTVLAGEFKRIGAVSGEVVADDMVHVSMLDDSADAYALQSFALYLQDGTLFAIYGQADAIVTKTASSFSALAVDVVFADISAALLQFGNSDFLNPPATTSHQGVVELATTAEAQAGIDALRALTPAAAKAAILGWLLAQDGSGSGLDADLLDGQQGSYYANVTARLGYTPVNKAGDMLTSVFSYKVAETSGIAARPNGNTPLVAMGSDAGGPAVMTFHRPGSYATFFGVDTDNQLKFGGWSAGAVANVIWHSANDGAGSGLDADLLDGRDSSAYAILAAPGLFAGPIKAASPNAVLMKPDVSNSRTVIHRNDNSNYYLLVTDPASGGPSEAWNGLRPFQINLATGELVSSNGQNFSGGTYINSNVVWHGGNDGAGSGLDADLLDGLQASQFLRNYVGNWISSEEGTARFHFVSGGATYMRIPGSFFWQNSQSTNVASLDEAGSLWTSGEIGALRFRARSNGDGYAMAVGDDAWIGDVNLVNGIAIRGQGDSRAGYVTFGTAGLGLGCNPDDATLRYAQNPVWHAGNDGAGSGLDADLLDGWQRDDIRHWNNLLGKPFNWSGQEGQPQWVWGSNDGGQYFVWNPSNFSVNYANSAGNADMVDGWHLQDIIGARDLSATGWCKLPSGLILQWGRQSFGANSYGTITFPIAFAQACFYIGSGVATEVGNGDAQANCPLPYAVNTTTASMYNAAPAASAWWLAIGV